MKALKFIVLAMVLSMLIPSYAFSEDFGAARTTLIERGAYIYTDDDGKWIDAVANFPLREGDALWSGEDGRVEINVRGGTYLRMGTRTLLEVLQVGRFLDSDENRVRFFLEEGRVYINNERSGYEYVQIESGFSAVRVPEGAVAMVDVYSDGTSEVSVLKGHVISQSSGGGVRLDAGSAALIGVEPYARIMPIGQPTAWESWNRDRDKEVRGVYASTRYLPPELSDYSYDFDEYGSWVYARDYGYVWRPTLSVSISLGWAPYRHGHWRWRHGHYVWVSFERWGWAPYHYGRWAFVGGVGWCWVPPARGAVYWGPGYVAWVYTSGYVGWVPLAPYETYYGYGYYGPNSVNIIDIDINKTVINNVYVNSSVKDAVTVVERDSFLRGTDRPVKPSRDLFAKGRKGVGPPPDFRPDREGKPVARDTDVYKPGVRGTSASRPEAGGVERPMTRPEPPGRAAEKRTAEPGRGAGKTEERGRSVEIETPRGRSSERPSENVITPPSSKRPDRGAEREVAPPVERGPVTTFPSRESAPGRMETPSSRESKPSRETAPGRMETPSRESSPSRGSSPGWSETPSRESAPGRMEKPSRESSQSWSETPSRGKAPSASPSAAPPPPPPSPSAAPPSAPPAPDVRGGSPFGRGNSGTTDDTGTDTSNPSDERGKGKGKDKN